MHAIFIKLVGATLVKNCVGFKSVGLERIVCGSHRVLASPSQSSFCRVCLTLLTLICLPPPHPCDRRSVLRVYEITPVILKGANNDHLFVDDLSI